MEEKEDCMDVVQRLNERYQRFMSDYSNFYKRGQIDVADSLSKTWTWYLYHIRRDLPGYAKGYISTLLESTDKYIACVKNDSSENRSISGKFQ